MKIAPRILVIVLPIVILCCLCWWWWGCCCCSAPTSTILLVRHAEKALSPPDNPPLSDPAGIARAQALAHVAAKAGVSAIFTSTLLRTIQTAAPLETALGITHREFDPNDTAGLANAIKAASSGQTVLVVGHTNTVPALIQLLGGPSIPNVDDAEFDNLFVLTVCRWRHGTLAKLQYGAPSP
jgi:broad specificity phosphatase PhoE